MRHLALDPATTTGFAHGECGKRPISGIIRLPDRMHPGRRFHHLFGVVRSLIEGNEIERVFIETLYIVPYRKRGSNALVYSRDQIELSYGYHAAIKMAVEAAGLGDYVIEIAPVTWRSSFGVGRAPKTVKDARAWLKAEAMKRCLEYGWQPKTDDEADALGLWAYGETLLSAGDANARLPLLAQLEL